MATPNKVFTLNDGFTLPSAPAGKRVSRFVYASCPGSKAILRPIQAVDPSLSPEGIFTDGWWSVECDGVPPRTFRTFRGAYSVTQVLVRYGFMNADSSCVHQGKVEIEYEDAATPVSDECLRIPKALTEARGVPQFEYNSGVCWYATMCWVSFCNTSVRDLICANMSEELKELCANCLFSRDAAQELRNKLWTEHYIGDNVGEHPLQDGCNGFSEFMALCATFKVPLLCYEEHGGELVLSDKGARKAKSPTPRKQFPILRPTSIEEPHLLAIRFQFGDHKRFPAMRRMALQNGARYRLIGIYIGQNKCGHQIGAASYTGCWSEWGFGDADLHKDGIGPIFVRFPDNCEWEDWWAAWDRILHVTRFGINRNNTCNMSLHNPSETRGSGVGEMSADWVYSNAKRC